jgi:hypothetical protein
MELLRWTPPGSSEEQVRTALAAHGLTCYSGQQEGGLLWRYRLDHDNRGESRLCAELVRISTWESPTAFPEPVRSAYCGSCTEQGN